jgi:putative flippase GtrA
VRRLTAKLFRFASVGIANGIIYGLCTSVFVSGCGVNGKLASMLGYLTAIPFAFFAHRSFTFASHGALSRELPRFAVAHVTSLVVSVIVMAIAIDVLNVHYSVGVIAGVILAPIVNFIVLNSWVFRNQKDLNAEKRK